MKQLKGFVFVSIVFLGAMFFSNASPLLAEEGTPKSSEKSVEKSVLDIQAECKAIDEFTSYRKVEVSPTAAAEEGNASDILAGYYDGNVLRKIATHAFGDKGIGITEYYYAHDQLIFVSWHTPSYEGAQPKEGFGQFYFKDGKLIEWMDAGGKVVDAGPANLKNSYAKREISVKVWADEARKRIEGVEKK